jgi:hypothetical protein
MPNEKQNNCKEMEQAYTKRNKEAERKIFKCGIATLYVEPNMSSGPFSVPIHSQICSISYEMNDIL